MRQVAVLRVDGAVGSKRSLKIQFDLCHNLRVIMSLMKAVHRLAAPGDVDRLFELRRQSITKLAAKGMSFTDTASWAEKLTIPEMEKKIRELEVWVAEVNGTVVGWGAMRGDRLEGLYVEPDFAGRGIGAGLLSLIEELMRGRDIPAVHAEASSNAVAFYLRRGYERCGLHTSEGAQPIKKYLL